MGAPMNNGRPRTVRDHPHGPKVVDGALIIKPHDGPVDLGVLLTTMTAKLDVLALGLDAIHRQEEANGAQLVALVEGVNEVVTHLGRAVELLDAIKLPAFLTGRK